jgi:hypothetical protein
VQQLSVQIAHAHDCTIDVAVLGIDFIISVLHNASACKSHIHTELHVSLEIDINNLYTSFIAVSDRIVSERLRLPLSSCAGVTADAKLSDKPFQHSEKAHLIHTQCIEVSTVIALVSRTLTALCASQQCVML